ncbi:MAG: alanine/ornithine racemase family PLP-dependent enzyme [Aminipila sp.]
MRYPVLEIDLEKLRYNAKVELDYLHKRKIEVMAVNKVFNGMKETAEAVVQSGMKVVAESILDNLIKIKDLNCEKALLRTPGLSEIKNVIKYVDISLVSEITIIKELSKEAVRQNKIHKVLIMIDMGDIREGIWFEETEEIEVAVRNVLELPGLEIYGLGTNYGCYGTILANEKNTNEFVKLANYLEKKLSIKFKYLSGGNCSSYYLVEKGVMPSQINHLRIGGQHIFGIEYVEGRYLDGYYHSNKDINKYVSDAYILKAEIIEIRKKPTVPVGELGVDSFMKSKTFVDRGIRKKAILSFGLQEVPYENIHPVDENIQILGQTSNHTIIDINDTNDKYQLGDIIKFEVDYTALMLLCNADSVKKVFLNRQ